MRRLLLTLFLLALVTCALPQSQQERKRVAVVLSGGGAKGMAHIGALKVIERAGIPVDIVTGTSMGSIVGGLYAIGYNAHLLDSLVRVQDWGIIIGDREDPRQQSLAERRKQNTYIITKELTLGKLNMSDYGIIKGKNLSALFEQLCTGYTDSIDFNTLPIPFACVATDIIDNTEYDFHSGRLPLAMRASMSIPAAFSPVRLGERVLVDGGLRNNYPADLAREMGADIIIGVTVQGAPKTAEDMSNTMSILSQIIDVNCKNKYDDNLAITDVPIRVNTSGYNAASFTSTAIDTLIRRGEEEAMRHWDELIALKQRIGIDSNFRPRQLTPPIQTPDEGNRDGQEEEKTSRFSAGFRFDTEEKGAMQLNANIPLRTKPHVNTDLTLRLGSRILARADFSLHSFHWLKPEFSYFYAHHDIDAYNGGDKDYNITYNQHEAELSLVNFNIRNFNVRLAARWDHYDYRDRLVAAHQEELPLENDHYISYRAQINYDSENSWYFPTRGARFKAQYAYLTDNFTQFDHKAGISDVSAMWRMSFALSEHFSLQPMAYGRLLFGSSVPVVFLNVIGGEWFGHYVEQQMPFAGVGHIENTDRHFIAVQLQAQQRIATNNYVLLRIAGAQHNQQFSNILKEKMMLGAQAAYYYNTIIGPIGATLGWSNKTKEAYFYVNLGYEF